MSSNNSKISHNTLNIKFIIINSQKLIVLSTQKTLIKLIAEFFTLKMYIFSTKDFGLSIYFIFLIIYSNFKNANLASVPPGSTMADLPYFGSRIFHYLSIFQDLFQLTPPTSQPAMISPNTYSATQSFGKSYTNISSIHLILSTFSSNVIDYFGFNSSYSYSSNPTTSIHIVFTIKQNSSFILMGFSAIIIAEPFNHFFLYHYFNIYTNNVPYSQPFKVPEINKYYLYVK